MKSSLKDIYFLILFHIGLFPPDPIGADNATFSVNPQNRPGSATDTHSCSQVRPVPAHLRSPRHMWPKGLDQFYQKYTEAYGIPVLGKLWTGFAFYTVITLYMYI